MRHSTLPVGVAAIDLGASKIGIAIREACGTVTVSSHAMLASGDVREETQALLALLSTAMGGHKITRAGLASAPNVDAGGIITRWPNRPHWEGFALLPELQATIGCSIVAVDDGAAAALADASFFAGRRLASLVLGTGIGGGVALEQGGPVATAEFGHLVVHPFGPPCRCGRRGCLQGMTYHDHLPDLAAGIAVTITNLAELFDLDTISFSGGRADEWPTLLNDIRHALLPYRRRGQRPLLLYRSPWRRKAPLMGALQLAGC